MNGLDGYSFRARWLPCVLIGTPAMLATASWLPSVEWSLLSAAPLLAAIAAALSQLARNKGRDLQTRLWREWGGAPTTYVLRNGSERISAESLQRYRRFIAQIVPDIPLPAPEQERATPGAFAGVYSAVTTALINRTGDKEKFPRLYSENVAYGYWRNLLGLRSIGLWLAALAFMVAAARVTTTAMAARTPATTAAASVSAAEKGAGEEPAAGRPELDTAVERGALAVVAMLGSGIFFVFFKFKLTDELVKRAGFNYADRLVEATEQLVAEEKPK